jgi:hypothetical protein
MLVRCFPACGKESLSNAMWVGVMGLVIMPYILMVLAWALGQPPRLPTLFVPVLGFVAWIPVYLHLRDARVCISEADVEISTRRKIGWQDIQMVSAMELRSPFTHYVVRSIVLRYTYAGRSRTRVILKGRPDDVDEMLSWIQMCIPPGSGTVLQVVGPSKL